MSGWYFKDGEPRRTTLDEMKRREEALIASERARLHREIDEHHDAWQRDCDARFAQCAFAESDEPLH